LELAHSLARRSLRIEADQRVIVVAGLPVHHYRAEDLVASPSPTGSGSSGERTRPLG
jgi:hypothetical protein